MPKPVIRRPRRAADRTAIARGFRRPAIRVLAGAVLLLCSSTAWQLATAPFAAASQTDLVYTSTSTWTADPIAGRVHVLVAITATSHTSDANGRRYFYDHLALKLPAGSTGFTAATSGRQLAIDVLSTDASGSQIDIALGQRLYSGQSGSLDLLFDLAGLPDDRDLRIGRNVMSFPVSAFGSQDTPGSSVTVLFPPDFTVQEEFGGLTRAFLSSGEVVFNSGVVDDPTSVSAWFTATKPVPPGDFSVRSISVGPLAVALRYWSDDSGWADEVERVLRGGYPVLRDLIGLGDPGVAKLTVEESSTQEMGGFSGSYDPATGKIEVSYFADPFVTLHEMAHMWFNSSLSADRWIDEGFASYYAEQAVRQLGLVDHAPVLTDRLRRAAVQLNDWLSAGDPNSLTDAYLYAASLNVATQIAAIAGEANLHTVWAAARAGTAAYQPLRAPRTETQPASLDWRRLLDLLEQTTGREFSGLWRAWIVDFSDLDLLAQRTTCLDGYAALQTYAGTWDLPPDIRRSLGAWQFNQATAYMAQARAILDERDQIVAESAAMNVAPPPNLRHAFESSGIAAASTEASGELAVLRELSAAAQARTDNLDAAHALGLLGANPQADLENARADFTRGDLDKALALATSARSAWEDAGSAGQARLFGAACILAGLLILLFALLWLRPGLPGLRGRVAAGPVAPAAAVTAPVAAVPAKPGTARPAAVPRLVLATAGQNGHAHAPGSHDGDATPSDSAYELLQRGQALLGDRHNAQAAVVLERAARVEPGKGSILEALGRAYFNSGQHARAAETFEALLEIDPSAHYGHFALGLSFARMGRPAEARTHLRLAVALDPTSDTYRRALDKLDSARS